MPRDGGYYLGGDGFVLTDGTNVVWLEATLTGGRSSQEIATAIAAAAASDFDWSRAAARPVSVPTG